MVPLGAQEPTVDTPASTAASSVAATTRIVQPGDTLMTLSREWFETLTAASEPVTLAQVLIGIHRENPQAFGRDMNELLVGATVRLPDADTLRRTPRRVALEEVRATLGIWTSPSAATAVVDASSRSPISPTSPPSETRTPLPTSTQVQTPSSSTVVAEPVETLEARVARIENELADKQQQLDTLAAQQARAASSSSSTALVEWRDTLSPSAFGLIALVLVLIGLGVGTMRRRRRALRSHEPAPRTDTLVNPAPSRSDTLSVKAPLTVPLSVMESTTDPLEGDPPPLADAGSLIDLAQAYLEMGQIEAARSALQRALEIGDATQRIEAQRVLDQLSNP